MDSSLLLVNGVRDGYDADVMFRREARRLRAWRQRTLGHDEYLCGSVSRA